MSALSAKKKKFKEILKKNLPGSRSEEQLETLKEYLTSAGALPREIEGEPAIFSNICQRMKLISLSPNSILFLQGQTAESYFVTFSGAIDFFQTKELKAVSENLRQYHDKLMQTLGPDFNRSKLGTLLCRLQENKGFGEIGLYQEGPKRAVSALATNYTEMIEIEPDFAIFLKHRDVPQSSVADLVNLIKNHLLGEGLSPSATTQIALQMEPVFFGARTKICSEGDQIRNVVLIDQGEIKELVFQDNVQVQISTKIKGSMIGALEVLKGLHRFSTSCVAISTVQGFYISLDSFALIKSNERAVKKFLRLEAARVKFLHNHHNKASESLKKVSSTTHQKGTFTDIISRNLTLVEDTASHEQDAFEESKIIIPAPVFIDLKNAPSPIVRPQKLKVVIYESDDSPSSPGLNSAGIRSPLSSSYSSQSESFSYEQERSRTTSKSSMASKHSLSPTSNDSNQRDLCVIKVKPPPMLNVKPTQENKKSTGFFSLFKDKKKIASSLGSYLGIKTAVQVYANEDKREKMRNTSEAVNLEVLSANLEPVARKGLLEANLSSNLDTSTQDFRTLRSRESSLSVSRNSHLMQSNVTSRQNTISFQTSRKTSESFRDERDAFENLSKKSLSRENSTSKIGDSNQAKYGVSHTDMQEEYFSRSKKLLQLSRENSTSKTGIANQEESVARTLESSRTSRQSSHAFRSCSPLELSLLRTSRENSRCESIENDKSNTRKQSRKHFTHEFQPSLVSEQGAVQGFNQPSPINVKSQIEERSKTRKGFDAVTSEFEKKADRHSSLEQQSSRKSRETSRKEIVSSPTDRRECSTSISRENSIKKIASSPTRRQPHTNLSVCCSKPISSQEYSRSISRENSIKETLPSKSPRRRQPQNLSTSCSQQMPSQESNCKSISGEDTPGQNETTLDQHGFQVKILGVLGGRTPARNPQNTATIEFGSFNNTATPLQRQDTGNRSFKLGSSLRERCLTEGSTRHERVFMDSLSKKYAC